MSRPGDWYLLGEDGDPLPGNSAEVAQAATTPLSRIMQPRPPPTFCSAANSDPGMPSR